MVNAVKSKSKTTVKGKQATQPESAAPPLTTEQRAELLSKLSPGDLSIVATMVEYLSRQPKSDERHERNMAGIAAALGDDPAPATEAQPAPTESEKAPEFETVHIITRHVLARLMTAELGAMVCPPDDGFESFSNTYWLIEKAVQKALTWLDMDDAHKAAVYYSLSVNQ